MWTNAHEDRCARKLGFEYSATLNPYPDHIKIIEYRVIYRYCLICFEYSYRSPLPQCGSLSVSSILIIIQRVPTPIC